MDLNLTVGELSFRDQVRAFLAAELPEDIRTHTHHVRSAAADLRRWQQILFSHGWGAIHWPRTFGGLDATPIQQYLFELECAMAGAPAQLPFGLRMLGPVLIQYGSPEQQQRFLPRILSGDDWWCQGYSEPGAGSDLASLKTHAVRDGDHYVVNGQKCWNTLGQHADWMFCLARTDPAAKPQRGISMLLIDMKSKGITVRPTVLLDGSREVNEIWFDNVHVPIANRIGAENLGWTYAKFLLGHERANIAGVGTSKVELQKLKCVAAARPEGERSSQAHRSGGDRPAGLGVHQPSSTVGVAGQRVRFRAGVDPENSRLRNPPDDFRVAGRGGRHRCPAICGRIHRCVSQSAQAEHLRRVERNSEKHHRPDFGRAVGTRAWIFHSRTNNSFCSTVSGAMLRIITTSSNASRSSALPMAIRNRCGRILRISGCWV